MLFWGGVWVLGFLIVLAFFIGASRNNRDDEYDKEEIHKEMKI